MPIGQHYVTCLHCGRGHLEGDCITNCCDICRIKGHDIGMGYSCPVCKGDKPEKVLDETEREYIRFIQEHGG